MRFVCSECGSTTESNVRPSSCPECSASAASFWELDGETEAVVVARTAGRGRRYLRIAGLAAALCLIATPLLDEQVQQPLLGLAASSPSVAPVRPFEWKPPDEDQEVSEIDRLAPGTIASWRQEEETPEELRLDQLLRRPAASGAGRGAGGAPADARAAAPPPKRPPAVPDAGGVTGELAATQRPGAVASGDVNLAGDGGSAPAGGEGRSGAGRSCPPEPDPPRAVVFIVDASVSMGLPYNVPVEVERMLDHRIDAGDEEARAVYRQLMAGPTPKRLDFAKAVFVAAIDRIPAGFNAGLVSFRSCKRVESLGPVPPSGFSGLRDHVTALAVQRGGDTAITESLAQARRLLHGTGGRVVLVTDGQETCSEDPCAVHADIAADGIVVDVVDLTGTAALECLAGPSGGRVHAARGRLDVAELTRFAADMMDRACMPQ